MSHTMLAMVLEQPGTGLRLVHRAVPAPGAGQILIAVEACGFCRTGRENLCEQARFTGYQIPGGYAQYTVADARYCFALPDEPAPEHLAPLLCAGLIGYRALRMAGDARRLGVYGFGAAAHLITQVARRQGREVFAFTRPGDAESQAFARRLGAAWAGGSDETPPEPLDAALIFAPAGALVPLIHPVAPWRVHEKRGPNILTGAQGIWLTDGKGQQLLDAFAGLWCVNVGYGQESV